MDFSIFQRFILLKKIRRSHFCGQSDRHISAAASAAAKFAFSAAKLDAEIRIMFHLRIDRPFFSSLGQHGDCAAE